DRVRSECPEVEWVHNFAILGPYDYVDVFRAPDEMVAFKVATIIRTYGHCVTEVWTATEWARFKNLIQDLAEAA
ncbi:MAG: GYD domain-containing protein, partial [Syntrophobacteraceae bacterium]